jgi:hypothetical protein
MRQQARRESARAWVASGAPVSVKAFARRYGVDRYTAYADLIAIGFRLAPGDNRWAVRPAPAPKRPPAEAASTIFARFAAVRALGVLNTLGQRRAQLRLPAPAAATPR